VRIFWAGVGFTAWSHRTGPALLQAEVRHRRSRSDPVREPRGSLIEDVADGILIHPPPVMA